MPQLSLTATFGLVLASVLVFLAYIAQSTRAASSVARIAEETREVLER